MSSPSNTPQVIIDLLEQMGKDASVCRDTFTHFTVTVAETYSSKPDTPPITYMNYLLRDFLSGKPGEVQALQWIVDDADNEQWSELICNYVFPVLDQTY